MKLLLKVVAAFAVAGLLLLLAFSYFENEHGLKTNASDVLRSMENAGAQAVQDVSEFLKETGIEAGARSLIGKAEALLSPSGDAPDAGPSPEHTPAPE